MDETKQEIESRLMQRISEGDKTAFRSIFELYTPKLLRYVTGMVKSKPVAEEIVQDVFLKIWTGRASLPRIESPDHYLFIIARNKVLDYFRKAASDNRLRAVMWNSISEDRNETEERVDENSSRRLIARGLDQLSEHKQHIFQLSRYEGLSHEEIARKLGISKNTVKNHLVETLRFLKDYLASHTDPVIALILLHFLSS